MNQPLPHRDIGQVEKAIWPVIVEMVRNDHNDQALSLLEQQHILWHDRPLAHLRIHLLWFWMGWRQGRFSVWIKQVFPVLFAVPVALVHRYLHIRRKGL